MDELGHDLHVRRITAYDHFVLQEPHDELIERIARSSDGPATSQIPIILHVEMRSLITIEKNPLRGESVFSLKRFGLLPTLHALIHKRTPACSNLRSFPKRLSIHSCSMLSRSSSRIRSTDLRGLIASITICLHCACIRNCTESNCQIVRFFGNACSVCHPITESVHTR